jgi:flagellar hook-associated protein 3 FlgL
MLSSLDPAGQQFLNNLNTVADRMARAQQEVSSGLKVSQVSDAPDSISLLLQARANLSSAGQTLSNLGRVATEVDAGEKALENAVTLFEQARTLGAQGNTDTQTPAGRIAIAQQLDSILQELVGIAGTSVEARYIFSGDADQQVPYTYNAALVPPISAYLGTSSTRLVQHPNGTTFAVGLTAQQIFDSADPTTNVFSAIENLSAALKTNNSPAIQAAASVLPTVGDYLNQQLASYGNMQNKVAHATSFGQTLETQLKAEISNLQDADVTQSILEMTQASTQEQAALQARAHLPRTTLFDYLG